MNLNDMITKSIKRKVIFGNLRLMHFYMFVISAYYYLRHATIFSNLMLLIFSHAAIMLFTS